MKTPRTTFVYRNHRGEVAERTVEIVSLDYIARPRNDYRHSPGWFLTCRDFTGNRQGDIRTFELNSIQMPEEDFKNLEALECSYRITMPTEALLAKIKGYEQLRPIWAQGHTSEAVAAQVHGAALSQIWDLLGVDNQTDAMANLRELLGTA